MKRRALFLLVLAAACGGARARSGGGRCGIPNYGSSLVGTKPLVTFEKLRPYRNYYAITDLSPPAHLYTVWYHDVEPSVMKLRVTEDASGAIRVEQSGGWWGGLGMRPEKAPPAPPAELARLTSAVEDAVAPCADGDLLIAYGGRHRVLRVTEMIPHGERGIGWYANALLEVDDVVTRVEDIGEQESGFGLFYTVSGDAPWIAYTPPPGANGTRLLLAKPGADLTAAVLAAARALDAGEPRLTIDDVIRADDTALVPAGFAQEVIAQVTIYGRASDFNNQQGGMYSVKLSLPDAVFGGSATGRTTITVGKHAFVLAATLTSPPRTPAAERAHVDFAGTIAITVDGGARHQFSRSYPVSGPIDVEGSTVVAPTGFLLPGGSSSDPGHELLHQELPGDDQFESFDVYVSTSVFEDPRERE